MENSSATSLQQMREILAAIDVEKLSARGGWSVGRILTHCAQSIEYSLTAYPKLKPWLVRVLIGPMVLARFRRQGRMSHDLEAPVPGSPEFADPDPKAAMARLIAAIDAFFRHPGEFADHLAYGALDREAYDGAHLLHIKNHFEAFDQA